MKKKRINFYLINKFLQISFLASSQIPRTPPSNNCRLHRDLIYFAISIYPPRTFSRDAFGSAINLLSYLHQFSLPFTESRSNSQNYQP
jgi:hypothetical protein